MNGRVDDEATVNAALITFAKDSPSSALVAAVDGTFTLSRSMYATRATTGVRFDETLLLLFSRTIDPSSFAVFGPDVITTYLLSKVTT